MADRSRDENEDGEPELVTSELDEMTPRELGLIYADSTRTILFSKSIQWKAVASSLLIFGTFMLLAKYVAHGTQFMMVLKISSIVIAMAAIFMVVLFQFWQHTEGRKLITIGKRLFQSVPAHPQVQIRPRSQHPPISDPFIHGRHDHHWLRHYADEP